ncbi:MAG TPA: DNA-3-methyladenine glycosylase [Mycobacteriales bacterium]|nr:DNA-3-methyladenine glycosylase [Mycobacteriales bacterium]
MRPLSREFYDRPALDAARGLLGCVVAAGGVSVRITEVEAYDGANDSASHAFRGLTPRNAVMFGPPGHAYVYFTYGMHFCMNLVCGPPSVAAAVLLRAGEVVGGLEIAESRRPAARPRDLARGPARLCVALGVDRTLDGTDVTKESSAITVAAGERVPDEAVRVGPRVGISAAADWPYRLWIDGDPSVSVYRAHVARRRGEPKLSDS